MKFFIDSEFIEYPNSIDLISIGIKSEDGREYYAVNCECDCSKASEWVMQNVLEKMPEYDKETGKLNGQKISEIKEEILSFCGEEECEFYGYYSAYDWVVFCWIFGTMMDLPKNFPMFCVDLKQMMQERCLTKEWKQKYCPDPKGEHNALIDANWNYELYACILRTGYTRINTKY